MKRIVAVLFLLLIAFYLGAEGRDRCDSGPKREAPVCHILCADGCATAPLPVAPVAPEPDPLPRERHPAERPVSLISLDLAPEKDPPKA